MRFESFSGASATSRSQNLSGDSTHVESGVSGTCPGSASVSNGASLEDLVSGKRPELHALIRQHAVTASAHEEAGATSQKRAGDPTLRGLLKKVLEDGTITPQEIEQLKQVLGASGQNAGARGARGVHGTSAAGGHHCPHGGRSGAGGAMAPTGSEDQPGTDGPVPAPTPPVVTPPVAAPTPPVVAPPVAAPTAPADGSFTLGGTKVSIKGGSDAERAKTRQLFEAMYQKDPPFKMGIDSKAASGLDVTIKDLPPNVAGEGSVGGNTMSLDPEYIGDTKDYANTIAHELAHNLGQQHGAALEAFAAEAAAVTA